MMATITTSKQKNSTDRRPQRGQLPKGSELVAIRNSLQSYLDARPQPEQAPRLMGIMVPEGTMEQRDVGITPLIPLYHQHSLVYFVEYVGGEPINVGFAEHYVCGDILTPLTPLEITDKFYGYLPALVEVMQH